MACVEMHQRRVLRYDVLSLVRKVALDPTFQFESELEQLKLKKVKGSYIFGMTTKNETIEMEGIPFRYKVPKFYVSVRAAKMYDFLVFVKTANIKYIELYITRTRCSKKMYNHWDYPSLKIYANCKIYEPYYGYYCYIELDQEIKRTYSDFE